MAGCRPEAPRRAAVPQDHNMLNTRGMLSGAVDRFKLVMSDKHNSKMFTIVTVTVFVLLLLYYLSQR
jgi:hypothetical protein